MCSRRCFFASSSALCVIEDQCARAFAEDPGLGLSDRPSARIGRACLWLAEHHVLESLAMEEQAYAGVILGVLLPHTSASPAPPEDLCGSRVARSVHREAEQLRSASHGGDLPRRINPGLLHGPVALRIIRDSASTGKDHLLRVHRIPHLDVRRQPQTVLRRDWESGATSWRVVALPDHALKKSSFVEVVAAECLGDSDFGGRYADGGRMLMKHTQGADTRQ
jgi:hypothetical protein